MSIFEPITSVDHSVDPPEPRRSLDPRSIQIAGLVSVGIVLLGLIVTNAARPEAEPRPALTSRGEPGAAAVEQVDLAPEPDPSVAPAPQPVDAADDPAESDEADDDDRWDELRDSLGNGRGNGNARGHWRD